MGAESEEDGRGERKGEDRVWELRAKRMREGRGRERIRCECWGGEEDERGREGGRLGEKAGGRGKRRHSTYDDDVTNQCKDGSWREMRRERCKGQRDGEISRLR